jgi:Uma2 family endonuclease
MDGPDQPGDAAGSSFSMWYGRAMEMLSGPVPHTSSREPAPRRSSPREDVWEALRAEDQEEKMGQGALHGDATALFADVTKVLVGEQHRTARVAWDLFVEWDPNDPRARVSPDVLLLDGQPPDIEPSIWQTWKPSCDPPRFALEIVSDKSRAKDYDLSPSRYAALGTEELAVFDPAPRGPDAFPLQVFRRSDRGQFLRVYAGPGPAESVVLRAWLVVTDGGERVRLAHDAEGRDLIPTPQEQARAATERAETAEAKVQQLEEELARLRAKG